ncbi:MAG TPA: heme o synthase [Gammaproteobacteria bacterium]|nr:heme o synthase [Gammaproteobacteria bacterium]
MIKVSIFNDYLTLCKPKVVLLMLITAWVGMYLASPHALQWHAIAFGTLGIASAASAAAIINHLMDRQIDRKMSRTAARPIATGRITPLRALLFAASLGIVAWFVLSQLVNMTTALLTFATLIGYAVIYTMYLKRATPQNIVIGGLSGAMPPLLGWTAISGTIHAHALLLVLIIFTWTPPHFWALAVYRADDYAAAHIPMLPVTHGIKFTKLCLLLYTLLLLAVSCLPFVVGMVGYLYLSSALLLNGIFIYMALHLYKATGPAVHVYAIKTFNFSIIFLLLIFTALIADHGVHI